MRDWRGNAVIRPIYSSSSHVLLLVEGGGAAQSTAKHFAPISKTKVSTFQKFHLFNNLKIKLNETTRKIKKNKSLLEAFTMPRKLNI